MLPPLPTAAVCKNYFNRIGSQYRSQVQQKLPPQLPPYIDRLLCDKRSTAAVLSLRPIAFIGSHIEFPHKQHNNGSAEVQVLGTDCWVFPGYSSGEAGVSATLDFIDPSRPLIALFSASC
jgi:hypothetical protein